MAIRPIKVGIVERSDSLFTLGNGVASFNAEFIKKNNLEKMAYVKFYMDDEDPYFLGFEFFEYSEIDSLRLMAPSRENKSTLTTGATRRVKTGGLTNQHRIARAVSKLKNIDDRAFEIIKNPNEKYFKEVSAQHHTVHEEEPVEYLYKTLAATVSSADYSTCRSC